MVKVHQIKQVKKNAGAPLGATEAELVRKELKWPLCSILRFRLEVYADFGCKATATGMRAENNWNQLFMEYQSRHPDLATELLSLPEHDCRQQQLAN